MIKRAMVLAGFALAAACASSVALARGGVDVGVFVTVPGPMYAAPPVIYQPPPVVYAPAPVYGGYGYYPDYGRGRGWHHDHGRHRGWDGGGRHHGHRD